MTDEAVEAVAATLYDLYSFNRVAEWDDVADGVTGDDYRDDARTVLRAIATVEAEEDR